MKNQIKEVIKTFFYLIIFLFPFVLALGESMDLYSLKIQHENTLQDKISRSLRTILSSNEFLINVSINLKPDALIETNGSTNNANSTTSTTSATTPTTQNTTETPNNLTNEATSTQNPSTPNPSTVIVKPIENYDNGENSLFIDKFDFSTPIEITMPNNNATTSTSQSVTPQQSAVPITTNNQIQLVNEKATTLFDKISDIKIEIILDSNLDDSTITMVKDLITRVNLPLFNVLPQISYSSISLIPTEIVKAKKQELEAQKAKAAAEQVKAQETMNTAKEDPIIKLLKDLKVPLAIVVVGIMLSLMSVFAVGKLMKFGNRFLGTIDDVFSKPLSQQAREAGPPTGHGGEGIGLQGSLSMAGGSISLDGDVPLVGFDRFSELLKSAPTEALLLIRRWLNNPQEGSDEALTIIIKKATTDDLLYIFDNLTVQERSQWKKHLVTILDRDGLRIGDTFMEAQIMNDIILPPPTIDKNSKRILSKISPEECAAIIKDDLELGSILVNVLPTDFIVNVYDHIDSNLAQELTDYGLNYTDGLLNEKKDLLDKALQKLEARQREVFAPFQDKLIEMIPIVGLNKEKSLFDSLIANGKIETVKHIAKRNFPGELIPRLSPETIRKFLMKYPRNPRIEFLLSLNDREREFYMSVFGDESAKMRSFIKADMDLIAKNLSLIKQIEMNKDTIGRAFVSFFRKELSKDETVQNEINILIDEWLSLKKSQVRDYSNVYNIREAA